MIVRSVCALTRIVSANSRCCAAKIAIEQQISHPDDAVHRRPDLVAHLGEELAFSEGRRLRRFLGQFQDLFGFFGEQ